MRVPLEKVPVEVWRQAARHLESIRGAGVAPPGSPVPVTRGGTHIPIGAGTEAASLGAEVCPLYRPDVKGIAYWEFEIVGLKRPVAEGLTDPRVGTGAGFIVVAAGRHDVPIPHWSLDRNAPSRALEAKLEKGAQAATVYKIDALCYVAEDAGRKYLSHLGQFPPLVGLPAAAQKLASSPGSARYASAKSSPNDDKPPKLTATIEGRKPPNAKMLPWGSWAKAKQSYGKMFRPQLQAMATRAAARWQIEDQLAKFGEGIHAGQSLVVPLLKPGRAALAGDGVKLVKLTTLTRRPPAVQLTALDTETKGEVHFTLELAYADGSSETLPFFVVPTGTPSNKIPVLPVVPVRPLPPTGLPPLQPKG